LKKRELGKAKAPTLARPNNPKNLEPGAVYTNGFGKQRVFLRLEDGNAYYHTGGDERFCWGYSFCSWIRKGVKSAGAALAQADADVLAAADAWEQAVQNAATTPGNAMSLAIVDLKVAVQARRAARGGK